MLLKYVDRTWILLGRLIEEGQKEGTIKHIEIPLKEWKMLVGEWRDLNPNIQEQYIKKFKVTSQEDIPTIRPEFIMDEDFVDKWVADEYDVYYKGVRLVIRTPNWKSNEDKAESKTELKD